MATTGTMALRERNLGGAYGYADITSAMQEILKASSMTEICEIVRRYELDNQRRYGKRAS